jgi:hypothetical protein
MKVAAFIVCDCQVERVDVVWSVSGKSEGVVEYTGKWLGWKRLLLYSVGKVEEKSESGWRIFSFGDDIVYDGVKAVKNRPCKSRASLREQNTSL